MKLRGIELHLHENEALSNAIRRSEDFFESEILDYIRDNHNKQVIIVDVGANIGNHTVYFANFLQYQQIVAFEPIDANFQLLAKNIETYRNVVALPIALSDYNGNIQMSINRLNMGASQVDPNGEITVIAEKLDTFFQYNEWPITLLKIDAEWHEPAVIEGAHELISRWKPLILLEDANKEYEPLLTWFGKGGYVLDKGWDEHKTYLYRWEE